MGDDKDAVQEMEIDEDKEKQKEKELEDSLKKIEAMGAPEMDLDSNPMKALEQALEAVGKMTGEGDRSTPKPTPKPVQAVPSVMAATPEPMRVAPEPIKAAPEPMKVAPELMGFTPEPLNLSAETFKPTPSVPQMTQPLGPARRAPNPRRPIIRSVHSISDSEDEDDSSTVYADPLAPTSIMPAAASRPAGDAFSQV